MLHERYSKYFSLRTFMGIVSADPLCARARALLTERGRLDDFVYITIKFKVAATFSKLKLHIFKTKTSFKDKDCILPGPLHERVSAINKIIVGPDAIFDFDMLIAKGPNTDMTTPWHQDESYWPDMPDKRTATCWVALDNATVDNGCMWFVPGSHKKPLRQHRSAAKGAHILQCDCTEDEGVSQPLPPGSCSFHTGRTLHYTRGNTTTELRRAYITNYRPVAMVKWERQHDFAHGKQGIDVSKRADDVQIVRRQITS